ncbi:NAD(P)-binding protein, partial [Coniochaeta ligniaria NRRL 30616]
MAPLIWLVTGTTSGIGAALIKHIVERGDKVIATGRKAEQRLGHLISDSLAVLELDICAGRQHVQEQVKKAWEIFGRIDVLVNNAGASAMKSAEEADDTYIANLFQVNFFGQMHVTQAILPLFRKQGSGTIVFTSSSTGWAVLPFLTHYAASKAALTTYVEGLAKEVRPFGIRCMTIESGGFPTHLGQPREAGDTAFGAPTDGVAEYGPLFGEVVGMFGTDPMSFMPGDLTKVGPTIVDIVKGEGVAAGKKWAVHVVIGSDSYAHIKQKCEQELQLLETWKDVSFHTDRAEHSHTVSPQYLKFVSLL